MSSLGGVTFEVGGGNHVVLLGVHDVGDLGEGRESKINSSEDVDSPDADSPNVRDGCGHGRSCLPVPMMGGPRYYIDEATIDV